MVTPKDATVGTCRYCHRNIHQQPPAIPSDPIWVHTDSYYARCETSGQSEKSPYAEPDLDLGSFNQAQLDAMRKAHAATQAEYSAAKVIASLRNDIDMLNQQLSGALKIFAQHQAVVVETKAALYKALLESGPVPSFPSESKVEVTEPKPSAENLGREE